MKTLTWLNAFWAFWLLQFLGFEFYFLAVNARYTLSETVWTIEGVNLTQPFDFPQWTATHWLLAMTVWVLFAWLSVHLPFGMLR